MLLSNVRYQKKQVFLLWRGLEKSEKRKRKVPQKEVNYVRKSGGGLEARASCADTFAREGFKKPYLDREVSGVVNTGREEVKWMGRGPGVAVQLLPIPVARRAPDETR